MVDVPRIGVAADCVASKQTHVCQRDFIVTKDELFKSSRQEVNWPTCQATLGFIFQLELVQPHAVRNRRNALNDYTILYKSSGKR
jgi:peptide methionine sulfoxide reductase MsrB